MLRTTWRRPSLSQNFLHSRGLVKQLIGRSSIGKKDLVIEIGPGTGIITQELLTVSRQVIAVELDPRLYHCLCRNFSPYPNLRLYCQDFLQFKLPHQAYKVFANLPFSIEAKAVRRLLNSAFPPEDCYLVVRRELALRWAGISYQSQFSLLYQPWFEFSLFHYFKRSDFTPKPRTPAAMLRFKKRTNPLIPLREKSFYRWFVLQGFSGGRRINKSLKNILGYQQLSSLAQQNGFSPKARPTELSFSQWLSLYCLFKARINP